MKSITKLIDCTGSDIKILANICDVSIPLIKGVNASSDLVFSDSVWLVISIAEVKPKLKRPHSFHLDSIGYDNEWVINILNGSAELRNMVTNYMPITSHPVCGKYFPCDLDNPTVLSDYVIIGHRSLDTDKPLTVDSNFFKSLDKNNASERILEEFTSKNYVPIKIDGLGSNIYLVEYIVTHLLPKTSRDDICIGVQDGEYHIFANDDIHAMYVLAKE